MPPPADSERSSQRRSPFTSIEPPPPGKGAPGGADHATQGHSSAQGARLTDAGLEAALRERASRQESSLDWKNSVADLLRLFDMPSDDAQREALAHAMGYDRDPGDRAGRNLWLHAQLLKQAAAHGGEMPDALRQLASQAARAVAEGKAR